MNFNVKNKSLHSVRKKGTNPFYSLPSSDVETVPFTSLCTHDNEQQPDLPDEHFSILNNVHVNLHFIDIYDNQSLS